MKYVFYLIFLTSVLLYTPTHAANWHVLVYMDSSDDLNDMAIKNITDMIRADTHDTVTIHIQLHSYDTVGLRFEKTNNGLRFVQEVALTGNSKKDFIDAVTWGFDHHDGQHTMLILWNHGWGILDPQWNGTEWQVGLNALNNSCPIKKHQVTRGFMFSTTPRTYLNNQDMIEGLTYVQTHLLNGKKIDILAFDTCMGGMLEVLYQVAPYAHYLVGNQVCSLRDGFDYYGIITALNLQLTPRAMAARMVHIFDEYYRIHDERGIYAHTALETAHVATITDALDNVITHLLQRKDGSSIALKAHEHAPRFCLFPMYTDCVAYIKTIETLLPEDESTTHLKQALSHFYASVQDSVVAHCAGYTNKDKTYGCTIYLPTYAIDNSYTKTEFAKNTKWLSLLKTIEVAAG